jgi:hypothetical protein
MTQSCLCVTDTFLALFFLDAAIWFRNKGIKMNHRFLVSAVSIEDFFMQAFLSNSIEQNPSCETDIHLS